MAEVETTVGRVAVEELGLTMTHEHLRLRTDGVRAQWPYAFSDDEDLEVCVAETSKLLGHGVRTVCDPSCMDLGRDVHLNLAVSKATGMRYVMATGVYGVAYRYLPMLVQLAPDVLVEYFAHDIEVGIQGTDVKAAFLKCAADEPGMVEDIVTLHEKVADASVRTDTSIMAHSNAITEVGLKQMALFVKKGVDPARVQIAHVGDTDNLDYIERLLSLGCYIGLDRFGMDMLSTQRRTATVVRLLERGYGDRIMLGQDSAIRIDGITSAQHLRMSPAPTYLFEHVLPELRQRGVTDEQIDAMLGSNVHAWLTGVAPTSARARAAESERRRGSLPGVVSAAGEATKEASRRHIGSR